MIKINSILKILLISVISVAFVAAQDKPKDYIQKLAGSELGIEMIGIPSGEFLFGSPENEKERKLDEGSQEKVKINAFWMAKYETTWQLYYLYLNREIDSIVDPTKATDVNLDIDAISGATIPYVDMSLGMGTSAGLPVVNTTQLAATKFCKWLSAKTGHFYRLPTEQEWEYACRAGSQTAYSFGNEVSNLGEYAWYYDNSDDTYKEVGLKKPNVFGLYDMHGNVGEWTSGLYTEQGYGTEPNSNGFFTVRGGSWDDDPDMLRSAARQPPSTNWNQRDPQLPKSVWWNTDAGFVGFRIVRDMNPPNEKDFDTYWGPKVPKKK